MSLTTTSAEIARDIYLGLILSGMIVAEGTKLPSGLLDVFEISLSLSNNGHSHVCAMSAAFACQILLMGPFSGMCGNLWFFP